MFVWCVYVRVAFVYVRMARPPAIHMRPLDLAATHADTEDKQRAHPELNQGPADLQSAALTTELCTHVGTYAFRA